jgi:hypothetical protein
MCDVIAPSILVMALLFCYVYWAMTVMSHRKWGDSI